MYSVNHVKLHDHCRKIVAFHDRWVLSRLESQAAQARRRSPERGSLNTYQMSCGVRNISCAEDAVFGAGGCVFAESAKAKLKFTLVELLTVIAIISLLAGIIIPSVGKVREKARMTECLGQLRQLGIAVTSYAGDYNDLLPVAARLGPNLTYRLPSLMQLLDSYLDTDTVFQCPADLVPPTMFSQHGTSYEWNTLLNGRFIDRATLRIAGMTLVTPIIGDAEAYHGSLGRNYLYPEGRVGQSLELLLEDE